MNGYAPLRLYTGLAAFGIAAVSLLWFANTALALGTSSLAVMIVIRSLLWAAFAFASVSFCIWIHRACRNAWSFDVIPMTVSPAWSVGGFFIPVLSLFLPYRAMREIWRASTADADFPSTNVTIWWAGAMAWGPLWFIGLAFRSPFFLVMNAGAGLLSAYGLVSAMLQIQRFQNASARDRWG